MSKDSITQFSLPQGFRFHPTDEELLVHYLCPKVAGHHFSHQMIDDIDLCKFNPWDIPGKAVFSENERFFFSSREKAYTNGSGPNRVCESGYWKEMGADKVVLSRGRKVGIKKPLVFYEGKAPDSAKTNWIMHEYRPPEQTQSCDNSKLDWVLCKIYRDASSSSNLFAPFGIRQKDLKNPIAKSRLRK